MRQLKNLTVPALTYRILQQLKNCKSLLTAKFTGFNTSSPNQIYIVNSLDLGANGERTENVSRFLESHGFSTVIVNSQTLFDDTVNNLINFYRYPFLFLIYRLIRVLVYRLHLKPLYSYLFFVGLMLRGQIIKKYLINKGAKIVISQGSTDLFCALYPRNYKVILDLPTIYSEEVRSEYCLTPNIISQFGKLEDRSYRQANRLCFHWYSFLPLAKKHDKPIDKSFILNWGTQPQSIVSKYSASPKIVYLGNVNLSGINVKLLSYIQQTSTVTLDVYSYEKPFRSSLKTLGYMSHLNHLADYQFGLLTFTNEELKNKGFSAKHLMYLNYGLPVLCPEWRRDKLLEPATIYYNQNNFSQQVAKYLDKKLWIKKHLAALKLAKELQWSKTLKPLLTEIETLILEP